MGKKTICCASIQKVVAYLNDWILKEELLQQNVISPQRRPFDNKQPGDSFIRAQGSAKLALIDVTTDMEQTGHYDFTHYKRVDDDELWRNY